MKNEYHYLVENSEWSWVTSDEETVGSSFIWLWNLVLLVKYVDV